MITPRDFIFAIAALVVSVVRPAAAGDRPFEVSLQFTPSEEHLLPDYQRLIREATDDYRGDFPLTTIFHPSVAYRVEAFPLPPFTLRNTVREQNHLTRRCSEPLAAPSSSFR